MRRVSQRSTNDCGIACVAMLAGVPYHVARRAVLGEGRLRLTKTRDLRAALIKLGKSPSPDRMKRLRGNQHRTLTETALLKTATRRGGSWHWMVWDPRRGRVLDPMEPPYERPRITACLIVRQADANRT